MATETRDENLARVSREQQNRINQDRVTRERPLRIALSKYERTTLVQALTGCPGENDKAVRDLRERLESLTD